MSPRARLARNRRRPSRRHSVRTARAVVPAVRPPRPSLAALAIAIAILLAISAAVARFLPLFDPLRRISEHRLAFYGTTVLPLGLKHAGVALGIWLLDRRRIRLLLLYWALTAACLLGAGGLTALGAFAALAALALALVCTGRRIGGAVLRPADRRWPIELGLGILALSFLAAVLGVSRIFFAPLIALPILAATGAEIVARRRAGNRQRHRFRRVLRAKWTFASVMAAELAWLLGGFIWVAAAAPESRSDALRAYLPFVKIFAHFHRMPAMPVPWAFVIPEGGPAFSAAVLALAGTRAMRYAMALCLLALVGIAGMAGAGRAGRAVALAVAVAVASTPLVLATTPTLMNEAFVSLGVVVVAWLAFRAKGPLDARFGFLFGAACGTAVAGKFTVVPYLALLAAAAGIRRRRAGWRALARASAGAAAGGMIAFLPWMIRSENLVGNPIFPFFTRWIPTRVYPHGLGSMNLNHYRIPGWASWWRAPFDFTYGTNAYVEGANGSLGLTVLFAFAAALVLILVRVPASARLLAGVAVLGAAGLWTQTAYARYWLPTLWLIAIASAWGFSRRLRPGSAAVATVLLGGLVFLHVPVMVAQQWTQPDGIPWNYYTGSESEEEDLGRIRGYAAIADFARRAPAWPVVLETGVAGCAHVDASCLELDFWHLSSLMEIHSVDRALALVRSTGAQYWAIDETAGAITFFRRLGVGPRLWRTDNLVLDEPPFRVYRIAPDVATPAPAVSLPPATPVSALSPERASAPAHRPPPGSPFRIEWPRG